MSIFNQAKVVTVSDNTNSFGLYGVIIMDRAGHTFEVGMGSIYKPKVADVLEIKTNEAGNVLHAITGKSYEIPQYKGQANKIVTKQVWGRKFGSVGGK